MDRSATLNRNPKKEAAATAAAHAKNAATTDKLRSHLYASTSAAGPQSDAGNKKPAKKGKPAPAPEEEPVNEDDKLTESELVRQAQAIHRDTTATTEQALKLVEESRQIKDSTLRELNKQNRKLEVLNLDMKELNQTLTYSEKLLRYMRRCCCCWMLDSCTGADPEARAEAKWQQHTQKSARYVEDDVYTSPGTVKATRKTGPNSPPPHRNPDTDLGKAHEAASERLNAETQKQNKMMDQIEKGLDELLEGAKEIGGEVDEQDRRINKLQSKAEQTELRVQQMNSQSQLRKYAK
ncbi:hypothetical protein FOA52_002746 [Chlamydomonas sp. UWO 241]|nr:hypothetical protein FOA52_002746 [Chlamydomonas sp. UWO 241]